MKHSVKAALWSAFVIPGAGQLILKRYKSAAAFITVSMVALIIIVIKFYDFVFNIAKQISNNMGDLDAQEAVKIISKGMLDSQVQTITIAGMIFMLCWILSIIDAYRAGEALDLSQSKFNSKPN